MKIYIVAFVASMLLGVAATYMISGALGPEINQLAESVSSYRAAETVDENGNEARDPSEPAVLVTITKSKELKNDVAYAGYYLGLDEGLQYRINRFLEDSLECLDSSKPSAVAVFYRSGSVKPTLLFAFPVKDELRFETTLSRLGSLYEKDGEKRFRCNAFGSMKFRSKDDYVLLATNTNIFYQISDIPTLLGDLPKRFDIGIKFQPSSIPARLRKQWMGTFENAVQSSTGATLEKQSARNMLAELNQLFFHTEKFLLGCNINTKRNKFTFQTEVIGEANQLLDNRSKADLVGKPTRFGGFYQPDAALSFNVCNESSMEDLRSSMGSIETGLRQALSTGNFSGTPLAQFIDAFKNSMEQDQLDLGASLVVDEGKMLFAAGAYVADTEQVNQSLLQYFQQVRKDGRYQKGPDGSLSARDGNLTMRPNYKTEGGITFHHLEFAPVILARDSSSNLGALGVGSISGFGKRVKVVLGLGNEAMYLAVGDRAESFLESCIEKSNSSNAKPAMIMKGEMRLSSFSEFVGNDTVDLRYIQSLMANSADRDRLSFTSEAVQGGYRSRVDVEMGFVRIVWKSIKRVVDRLIEERGPGGPVRVRGEAVGDQIPFSSMFKSGA